MPFFPIGIQIDFSNQNAAIIMNLKEKRAKDMRLLATMQDGNPVINSEGVKVVWSAGIRTQVEAELAETNRLIAELS